MKKRNLLLIIPVVLLIVLLKSCTSSRTSNVDNSTNEQLLKRVGELEDENKELKIEIEKLKNSVKSDFVYSFDNTSKVSSIYANYIMCGDIDMLFSYQNDINSLKKDDIKEAFKKYFNKSNLTIGVLKNG